MKLCFQNAQALSAGIAALAPDLGIELTCPCTADVTVEVKEVAERFVSVKLYG